MKIRNFKIKSLIISAFLCCLVIQQPILGHHDHDEDEPAVAPVVAANAPLPIVVRPAAVVAAAAPADDSQEESRVFFYPYFVARLIAQIIDQSYTDGILGAIPTTNAGFLARLRAANVKKSVDKYLDQDPNTGEVTLKAWAKFLPHWFFNAVRNFKLLSWAQANNKKVNDTITLWAFNLIAGGLPEHLSNMYTFLKEIEKEYQTQAKAIPDALNFTLKLLDGIINNEVVRSISGFWDRWIRFEHIASSNYYEKMRTFFSATDQLVKAHNGGQPLNYLRITKTGTISDFAADQQILKLVDIYLAQVIDHTIEESTSTSHWFCLWLDGGSGDAAIRYFTQRNFTETKRLLLLKRQELIEKRQEQQRPPAPAH